MPTCLPHTVWPIHTDGISNTLSVIYFYSCILHIRATGTGIFSHHLIYSASCEALVIPLEYLPNVPRAGQRPMSLDVDQNLAQATARHRNLPSGSYHLNSIEPGQPHCWGRSRGGFRVVVLSLDLELGWGGKSSRDDMVPMLRMANLVCYSHTRGYNPLQPSHRTKVSVRVPELKDKGKEKRTGKRKMKKERKNATRDSWLHSSDGATSV